MDRTQACGACNAGSIPAECTIIKFYMKKYLLEHISLMEKVLASEKNIDKLSDWLVYNRVQISFLQHERLIHLLVTFFFGLLLIIVLLVNIFYFNIYFVIVGILLIILLIFYLWHYYILENGVQKLYRLDQELDKLCHT